MKIKGIDLKAKPYDELTVHVLGQPVTFRAGVVSNHEDFKRMHPEPKAPIRTDRQGNKVPVLNDPSFVKKLEARNEAQAIYTIKKSLEEHTPDLSWEFLDDAELDTLTFDNLDKEFSEMGMPLTTAARVVNLATSANGLSEKMVSLARDTFLPEAEEAEALPE